MAKARRFFDFTARFRLLLQAGIFLPLAFYVITMLLNGAGRLSFPVDWDRFLFQFFIACSVVSLSFLHPAGKEVERPWFPFPIHNLFLIGIRNTLLVFRYVGIWWLAAGLLFLIRR